MHPNLASKFDIHIQFNNRKRQTSGIMITIHNNKQIGQQRCRNYYALNSESETMQLKKVHKVDDSSKQTSVSAMHIVYATPTTSLMVNTHKYC
ncbi:hypothetical protein BATDEDRAFT_90239 [Batrachochytrium dendrobatidis JAM81]|uniref:Uncharacterized protein n=1 Tax=Batrachochytrium dendrobatidis (strain JAM81 / FGSC 10211) TaxID=684364 RepID=F4P712_BATDJ|nr:uncharacterized protein BATDEDRAFT_90239 [Batrachochytrium dendrobatidis JAM81]EGF78967.1 hypothetical protein BATDEDRAFT_90239 [Batrachochytrium dendrobatidis JAM81]|eukprot:XP_006680520.1 hypothetical protein BATDEDRAFT_90239 [Batrachochytrium dendrobatidis JAM81]